MSSDAGSPPGPPPPAPDETHDPTTNGLAVSALVSGIVGVALFFLGPIAWIGSALALIFGFMSRRQIRDRGQNGDSFSIAGIVLGFVGMAIAVAFIGFVVVVLALGTYVKSAFTQTCDAFPPDGTSVTSCG